jgi:hypothetical protein
MLNAAPVRSAVRAAAFDFDGDGRTDIFDRPGDLAIPSLSLQTDGGAFQSRALAAPSDSAGWTLVGTGDFDGNGKRNDLLWRNRLTTGTAIQLIDQGQVVQTNDIGTQRLSFLPQVADFDGDGSSDIFWQHRGEQASEIWFIKNGELVKALPLPTVSENWNASIADFNADGKSDLLWQNSSTGEKSVWLLDGARILGIQRLEGIISGSDLQLLDFNGDGRTDILTRDRFLGRSRVWLWDETGRKPELNPIELPRTSPDGSFTLGDFDGDRRSDILFQGPGSPQLEIFFGQAEPGFTSIVLEKPKGQFIDKIIDLNGDGKTEIVTKGFFTSISETFSLQGNQLTTFLAVNQPIEPIVIQPVIQPSEPVALPPTFNVPILEPSNQELLNPL